MADYCKSYATECWKLTLFLTRYKLDAHVCIMGKQRYYKR